MHFAAKFGTYFCTSELATLTRTFAAFKSATTMSNEASSQEAFQEWVKHIGDYVDLDGDKHVRRIDGGKKT